MITITDEPALIPAAGPAWSGGTVQFHGRAALTSRCPHDHDSQHHQLQHRQRRGPGNVAELRSAAGDLHLVLLVASGFHEASSCGDRDIDLSCLAERWT